MLTGIRFKSNLPLQKKILSQPIGCARYICDTKNVDEKGKSHIVKKKVFSDINKTDSQYRVKDQTP